jgi:segregation and condensation protein A
MMPEDQAVTSEGTRGHLPESWRIDLPIFEGPLDLLLQLIRVNEVDLTDIPVHLVCAQFHEYLDLMEELDLDIAGDYIYEAALLIQLKSRMLLPTVASDDETEEDPRHELVQRLLEYQRLKDAAQLLAESDSLRSGMWSRTSQETAFLPEDADDTALDLEEVSLYDLLVVFRQALERYDREHPSSLVYSGDNFPIRNQFERYLRLVERGRPYDLLDDLLALSCRAEAIAAFLAILELGRLQLIRLHQTAKGEVLLYRTTRNVEDEELRAIQG